MGYMGDGWGWWMLFGSLGFIGFWGLVIWGVVTLARRPGNQGMERSEPREPSALEILKRRYARGELSDDEFEAMRRRLTT